MIITLDTPKIEAARDAILLSARRNPNITSAGLIDEMERGAVDGWLHHAAVRACNISQWTAAMCAAAAELSRIEGQRARAAARRAGGGAAVFIIQDEREEARAALAEIFGRAIEDADLGKRIEEANAAVKQVAGNPFTSDGKPAPREWFGAAWWLTEIALRDAADEACEGAAAADFESASY